MYRIRSPFYVATGLVLSPEELKYANRCEARLLTDRNPCGLLDELYQGESDQRVILVTLRVVCCCTIGIQKWKFQSERQQLLVQGLDFLFSYRFGISFV